LIRDRNGFFPRSPPLLDRPYDLHNIFSYEYAMRLAGQVARMEEKRNAYRISVGKPEGKRSLGRPRRRWVDNIKMDLSNSLQNQDMLLDTAAKCFCKAAMRMCRRLRSRN
jgi:hypothetical protein